MNTNRKHLRAALISALGYGLGFVIGVVFIELVLNIGLLESMASEFENQRLYVGLFILFTTVVLGGALAGTIGGLVLSYVIGTQNRKRSIARNALGIGVGFGAVLLPILGLVTMMAMYNAGGASPAGFITGMGVVGALFGLVAGLMTGTIPTKTNYWRVAGVAALAFGVGGIAFGFGLWHYFYTLYESGAAAFELLAAFFVFGAVGGFVLGWIFSLDQEKAARDGDAQAIQANIIYRAGQWFKNTKFYRKRGFWGTVFFAAVIFVLSRLLAMSPLSASSAYISDYLPSNTTGVHWSAPWALSGVENAAQNPSIAQAGDTVALVWEQNDDVFLSLAAPGGDNLQIWQPAVNISASPGVASRTPQVAIDTEGQVHIVWAEAASDDNQTSAIWHRACQDGECREPTPLSNSAAEACRGDANITPTIASSAANILVIWGNQTDNLPYALWEASASPAAALNGCALKESIPSAAKPQLAVNTENGYALAFENGAEIFVAESALDAITFTVAFQEAGQNPAVLVDQNGLAHTAWCAADARISYRQGTTPATPVADTHCLTRPTLGQDAEGNLHLLWYSDQVEQVSGDWVAADLIYESRMTMESWGTPSIVGLAAQSTQPTLTTGQDGLLHLGWVTDSSQVSYARYQVYECTEAKLNPQGQLALEVAQSGDYRPTNETIPYCSNQFDTLLILPQAEPAFSDIPTTTNGAFDQVSDLIKTAQYEVLLSTMWYETDETNTSPGDVLAQGVKALYEQVKAHPEQYPRGMTVRILLDNPPELTLSNLISQVWNVFNHLRNAGVPTMLDPEIGWKLEVANYAGSWPHGHTKMVIVDGKTAVAAGFNYQGKHLPEDHPSGTGGGQFDLGLQMTGPVAQSTQRAFDDLWLGANRIHCADLGSESPLWWLSCRREFATTEHVPEVQKYYLADANHNAFALHRTEKFNEADVAVAKAVASAEETLDIIQVNFTLKLICDLNLLFKVCDFSDALVYMESMMEAIEANQVKTRVLIKTGPIEAVESNIAVAEFRKVLVEKGLDDLVEFRYFNGSVHAKSVLIDDQFLLVGSQNFHYSAWGDGGGLTEFNIGTDDPQAVADFKRFFDYHWERGQPIPVE